MYSRLQYTVRKKFSVFYGYALEFQLTLSRRLPVLGHQYPPEMSVSFMLQKLLSYLQLFELVGFESTNCTIGKDNNCLVRFRLVIRLRV